MSALEKLPGIGPVNAAKLEKAGIQTPEQLRALGAEQAFLRIRASADPGACLHLLYGLEAGVQNHPKNQLPEADKQRLRTFFSLLP